MYPLDTESYPNYFLLVIDEHVFELRGEHEAFDSVTCKQIETLLKQPNYGFNSNSYDLPMLSAAVKKHFTAEELHELSDWIVLNNSKIWNTLKHWSIDIPSLWNHIDLIEPAPGVFISLKKYGSRLHSKTIADLPYPPDTTLTAPQMAEVLAYCFNDIRLTIDLYEAIKPRLDLRKDLGLKYKTDLMSKSDAQIAESIFRVELGNVTYTNKDVGAIRYVAPVWLKFKDSSLNELITQLEAEKFELRNGKLVLPKWIAPVVIGQMAYKFGIGGLHSTEKAQSVVPDVTQLLIEADVASYYPSIIRKLGLYPKHLGEGFNGVYSSLIDRRLKAKRSGNTIAADGLKITLNGLYGKFGSHYSFVYSPDLLLTVTLTGQLALLMLIELLEDKGYQVVSANTDGVVCLMNVGDESMYKDICEGWEFETGFDLEFTHYEALYSRDVNNYLAVKSDGIKGKGIFTDTGLMKDPAASIIHKAVTDWLVAGITIEETIGKCSDIREFVLARNCTGGAMWRGEYLGKTVRWIWSTAGDPITSVKNGNKVAGSDDAYAVMTLPERVPRWINRDKYIDKAYELLESVGK